jgi:hypothetical protein
VDNATVIQLCTQQYWYCQHGVHAAKGGGRFDELSGKAPCPLPSRMSINLLTWSEYLLLQRLALPAALCLAGGPLPKRASTLRTFTLAGALRFAVRRADAA